MPTLTAAQRRFLVHKLATYATPTEAAEAFEEEYGIEISRMHANYYHPEHSDSLAERWCVEFYAIRDNYLKNLNAVLQAELNPGRGPAGFRAGDKVMQLRNDYEREVFNGDIGWVQRVEDGVTYVEFDSGLRSYKADELDALTLAYASTIHKSQGSEFPAVVLALHAAHHVLLTRSLIYTAVTRAKRLVVLVGDPRAMRRAARTATEHRAFCRLGERLRDAVG